MEPPTARFRQENAETLFDGDCAKNVRCREQYLFLCLWCRNGPFTRCSSGLKKEQDGDEEEDSG